MKTISIIKKIITGSSIGEIFKLIALFTATLLLDKVGEVLEDSLNQKQTPHIDINFEEAE